MFKDKQGRSKSCQEKLEILVSYLSLCSGSGHKASAAGDEVRVTVLGSSAHASSLGLCCLLLSTPTAYFP